MSSNQETFVSSGAPYTRERSNRVYRPLVGVAWTVVSTSICILCAPRSDPRPAPRDVARLPLDHGASTTIQAARRQRGHGGGRRGGRRAAASNGGGGGARDGARWGRA
eukprot:5148988-Prymnesium_polylepis.1